jgi:S1-C subfamily serine protease
LTRVLRSTSPRLRIATIAIIVTALLTACGPTAPPEDRVQAQVAAELTRVAPTASAPATAATVATALPSATPQVLTEQDAVARVLPAVVQVLTDVSAGSGVIVDRSGLIITNAHVVEKVTQATVRLQDRRRLDARVERRDRTGDLALLRVSSPDLPAVVLADVDLLRLGEPVITIGYPLNLGGGPSVTRGLFSAFRTINGVDLVQTDAAINPGNSGGPLISLRGEVVGINTWGIRVSNGQLIEGINFAISSGFVRDFLGRANLSRPAPPTVAAPVPPVAAPTSRPPAGPVLDRGGPVDAVRQFYSAISAKNFPAAWALTSPRYRSSAGYQGWVKGFATTHSVQVQSATVTAQAATAATVAVAFQSVNAVADGGTIVKNFQGTWQLVVGDGGWKLDQASIRQVR